jgi:serine/threonine protein kinase
MGRHPHVVRLLATDAPSRALVLERAETSLMAAVQACPLSGLSLWAAVESLLSGIAHVHVCAYAHMDVKPDNVLLFGSGVLKLCDMGMATPATKRSSRCCGTLPYVAPEVLARSLCDTRSADAWSLGVTIFSLAYGFMPFVVADPDRDWRFACFSGAAADETIHDLALSWYRVSARPDPQVQTLITELLRLSPSSRAKVVERPVLGHSRAAQVLHHHFATVLRDASLPTSCTYSSSACEPE